MDNKEPLMMSDANQEKSKKMKALNHRINKNKLHHYRVVRREGKRSSSQSLVDAMERARLAEYAMYFEKPWRLLGMNFLIGLARGLGATIGLGLVLSILVFLAQEVISANLPGISQWMAELIHMVQSYSMQR